jgi:hypothetical protein
MSKYVAVLILSLTLFTKPAPSQNPILVSEPQAQRAMVIPRNTVSNDPEQQKQQTTIAAGIAERHAQLRRDTEKLVALTAELKELVDKTGVNILSMAVIKKAQEIQKLAKSVQDKMKNAY